MPIDDLRAAWGAAPARAPLARWSRAPRGGCVHYVGGAGRIPDTSHSDCLRRLRTIQSGAFSGANGWTYSDIEYNLAVCWHGRLIEARGLAWQGAAQLGGNSDYWSVLAMDNVDDVPGMEMLGGLYRARELTLSLWPAARELVGHRDVAGNPTGTKCPGDRLEAWVRNPTTIPQPPGGSDVFYRVVKGDRSPHVVLTCWKGKRWVQDRDEEAAIIAAGITDGVPLIVWPQVWVDRIPWEANAQRPPNL